MYSCFKNSPRNYAIVALAALILIPGSVSARQAVAHQSFPGFEKAPMINMEGKLGDWVRYRVSNVYLQQQSYMTLAVVEEDEEGRWLELRLSQSPLSEKGDLSLRILTKGQDEDLVTERVLLRFGGGRVVEIDMETLPEQEGNSSDLSEAGVCAAPDSSACRMAVSKGLNVDREPPLTTMTRAGSLKVVPVRVRLDDGNQIRLLISESVPITGLVTMTSPDGTEMELDGMGDSATPTLPKSAEVVAYSDLADALTRGSAAGGVMGNMGRLVNPDERLDDEEDKAKGADKN